MTKIKFHRRPRPSSSSLSSLSSLSHNGCPCLTSSRIRKRCSSPKFFSGISFSINSSLITMMLLMLGCCSTTTLLVDGMSRQPPPAFVIKTLSSSSSSSTTTHTNRRQAFQHTNMHTYTHTNKYTNKLKYPPQQSIIPAPLHSTMKSESDVTSHLGQKVPQIDIVEADSLDASTSEKITSTNTNTNTNGAKNTNGVQSTNQHEHEHEHEHEHKKLDLQLLLLDNYDSYTYNLHSYLSTICRKPPIVISNDAYATWEDLNEAIRNGELGTDDDVDVDADADVDVNHNQSMNIDGIIISPGPGRPGVSDDIGVCLEAIEQNPTLPILGVCLGHQALGHHYNATVKISPYGPVHGLTSRVFYTEQNVDDGDENVNGDDDGEDNGEGKGEGINRGDGIECNLFDGIPQGFDVVRYHSLVVEFPDEKDVDVDPLSSLKSLPISIPIEPIAWCKSDTEAECGNKDGNICMALKHKVHPHYGVQFHPESVGTGEFGYRILQNFCNFCDHRKKDHGSDISDAGHVPPEANVNMNGMTSTSNGKTQKLTQSATQISSLANDVIEQNEDSLSTQSSDKNCKYKVFVHKMSSSSSTNGDSPSMPSPEIVFENLFATMDDCFWLDSSTGRKDADMEQDQVRVRQIGSSGNGSKKGSSSSCPIVSNSRFSIMGGNLGPLCKKIEYWGKDHKVENRGIVVTTSSSTEGEQSKVTRMDNDEDIITYLRKEIVKNGVTNSITGVDLDDDGKAKLDENISVPFEFHGGYVGYLGYEVRHDTRNAMCNHEICGTSTSASTSDANELHRKDGTEPEPERPSENKDSTVPTAGFLFADRSLVYDHWRDEWYLVALEEEVEVEDNDSTANKDSLDWMRDISSKVKSMTTYAMDDTRDNDKSDGVAQDLEFNLKRSKDEYSADIARCHEEIRNGESYELCLTNQISTRVSFSGNSSPKDVSTSPFGLYKILRKRNPAPFSAFLKFFTKDEETEVGAKSAVSICCSSPERFLSVNQNKKISTNGDDGTTTSSSRDHGWEFAPPFVSERDSTQPAFMVETKPIKGTTSRIIANEGDVDFESKILEDERVAEELRTSVKNRAENLMIVDLLRNDLSRVCEPGSVHVPKLMGIESFATVHQMVSTIRGIVDPKYTAIDVIAASFPGGSMTGAPKLRSVDILDDLELGNRRGPYSGCLGYISLSGAMDMNIVIRTAVVAPDNLSNNEKSWNVAIGAGGAITALSESDDEFDEMLLKASAIKKSVKEWYNNESTK